MQRFVTIAQFAFGLMCVACLNVYAVADKALKPSANPKRITLKEAIVLAQSNNTDVLVAREQSSQQTERLSQSWAKYMPKLSIKGTYTANFPEIVTNFGSASQNVQQAQMLESLSGLLNLTQGLRNDPADLQRTIAQSTALHESAVALSQTKPLIVVVQPGNVFDAQLSLNQPLMNLASIAAIHTAQIQVQQSRSTVEQVSSTKSIEVARAYMQALKSLRVRMVAENALDRAKAQLKRMDQKAKSGLVRMADVRRMQVEENNARNSLEKSRADEQFALGNLGVLLGQDETFLLESGTAVKMFDRMHQEDTLVSSALSLRSELKTQQHAIKLAEQMRQSIYAKYFPTIDFSAQGYYTTNTAGFIDRAFRGLVMIQASMDIYDGGENSSKISEYQAKIREERAKSVDLQRQVQAQVQGCLLDIDIKRQALQTAQENYELSSAILEETQANYKSGLLDTLDLIDASHQLIESEIAIENARTDLELAQIELAYASGNIYEAIQQEG